MLVKFGEVGQPIKEYLVEDDYTVSDLLDMLDIYMSEDDVIHTSNNDTITYDEIDEDLEEGVSYVLSSVSLTDNESSMIDLIDGLDIDDMTTQNKKDLVASIVALVNENSWDQ